jgi:FG-GAP repeat
VSTAANLSGEFPMRSSSATFLSLLSLVLLSLCAVAANAQSAASSRPPGAWSERAQLTNTGEPGGITAVAASGNTVVVGGYVYVKPAAGWTSATQTAILSPSDPSSAICFGCSVAIDGNTIVIGAYEANVGSNVGQGAVYVFVEPAGGWTNMTETAKLTASDGVAYQQLGHSVGVSGNTIVAGTYTSIAGATKAYAFVEPAGGWVNGTQTAELTGGGDVADLFTAWSVAIDGGTIVTTGGGIPNRAYLFTEPAGGWTTMTQTAVLNAKNHVRQGNSGNISINGSTVVFGVPLSTEDGFTNAGTAYVFVEPAGGWIDMNPTAQLTASDQTSLAEFGVGVTVSGSSIVVGAPFAEVNSNVGQGKVYLFTEPAGGWSNMTQTAEMTALKGETLSGLGSSVGISGAAIVAIAPRYNEYAGATYIFEQ